MELPEGCEEASFVVVKPFLARELSYKKQYVRVVRRIFNRGGGSELIVQEDWQDGGSCGTRYKKMDDYAAVIALASEMEKREQP